MRARQKHRYHVGRRARSKVRTGFWATGRELIRRVLGLLRERYSVDLVCDDDLVPFYERLGFDRLAAMSIRNRSALP
jgi:predicted GNAT family N-acyltransferase